MVKGFLIYGVLVKGCFAIVVVLSALLLARGCLRYLAGSRFEFIRS